MTMKNMKLWICCFYVVRTNTNFLNFCTSLIGPTETLCPEGLFKCTNGKCISPSLTCNGNDDCGDESDEMLDDCRESFFGNSN